jgi:hypothetical protein
MPSGYDSGITLRSTHNRPLPPVGVLPHHLRDCRGPGAAMHRREPATMWPKSGGSALFGAVTPVAVWAAAIPGIRTRRPRRIQYARTPRATPAGGIVIDIVRTELWMGMHALKGLRINAYQVGPPLCSLGHDSAFFPAPAGTPPIRPAPHSRLPPQSSAPRREPPPCRRGRAPVRTLHLTTPYKDPQ